jgi:hypothetical protein
MYYRVHQLIQIARLVTEFLSTYTVPVLYTGQLVGFLLLNLQALKQCAKALRAREFCWIHKPVLE